MQVQIILTFILSIIFLAIGISVALSDLNYKTICAVISILLCSLFMILTISQHSYNNGQKDALLGKQKFRLQIHYELIDSMYIRPDTTVVLANDTVSYLEKLIPVIKNEY